ncbi:MAG: SDR family oxidoreductase [Methylobacterium sp.]|nr:SDR family oxidoreductase [Methylobacterium sp.]
MKLQGQRIVLTGANGGIGHFLATQLADKAARLLLVDRNAEGLARLCEAITANGGEAIALPVDLLQPGAVETVLTTANQQLGGVDLLINNAGLIDFTLFQQHEPARIAQIMQLNSVVPMLLARAVLPQMLARQSGRIINVGSMFGSIGFPHHAAYSASKFALRGFSQALRRELADSGVGVTYVSPRAVKTALNDARAQRMMEETGTAMDPPGFVAGKIIGAIEGERSECYIGMPESLFARLNGIFPALIDQGLKEKTRIAHVYADRGIPNKFNN